MFWKKKIPNPEKEKFNALEQLIIDRIIEYLPESEASKLKGQIGYLNLLKRLNYKYETATEMYPEDYNGIPKHLLFNRTEEFKLAHLRLKVNDMPIAADIYAVLGALFEIRIKPKFSLSEIDDISNVKLLGAKLDENLETNVNGKIN